MWFKYIGICFFLHVETCQFNSFSQEVSQPVTEQVPRQYAVLKVTTQPEAEPHQWFNLF